MSTPRLVSRLWISALLRRLEMRGIFGAVLQRGADEAGTIYLLTERRDRRVWLLGPAPGASVTAEGRRRFFDETGGFVEAGAAQASIARRRATDPDIWVVGIDDEGEALSGDDEIIIES